MRGGNIYVNYDELQTVRREGGNVVRELLAGNSEV